MNLRQVISVIGALFIALGVVMVVPLVISLFDGANAHEAFLISSLLAIGLGLILQIFRKPGEVDELRAREGFAIVTIGWVTLPLIGALPFFLSGAIPNLTDAYFESVSGFTTTGASILADVESLPLGVLFWRSFTHWLGGMGIIVLYLAILPMMGAGGIQLFKAEVAGPSKDKLTPRVVTTARLLWGIYVFLTVVEILLLSLGGMPLFDAICHSFGTIATGGFSTKNASIAFYQSAYIESVVTIFMLLAGVNFALHYAALKGDVLQYLRNAEFRYYISTFLIALTLLIIVNAPKEYGGDFLSALRFGAFNLASIMTCTGFATTDFALWNPLAQLVLFFLMFPGGCAGSTAGGIKNIRIYILLKSVINAIRRLIYPKAILPIRVDRQVIDPEVLTGIGGFLLLYLMTFLGGSMILCATGLDLVAALSGTASCLAGIGPGLSSVGPMGNYAHLTDVAKWVLMGCMVLGRLEILTVFVLFTPTFWKK